jgi:hypothetical protein
VLKTEHKSLVLDTLRIWVASRLIEKPWRICGEDTLGMTAETEDRSSPYFDRIPVTPMMDYQLDQIVINYILRPLRTKVLKKLTEMIKKNVRKNWFTIYLCIFILLQNYELATLHDRWYAIRNNLVVSVSKSLISMHYSQSIRKPIQITHCSLVFMQEQRRCSLTSTISIKALHLSTWSGQPKKMSKLPRLIESRLNLCNLYLRRYKRKVRDSVFVSDVDALLTSETDANFKALKASKCYEKDLYFCSQMYDPEWAPEVTL